MQRTTDYARTLLGRAQLGLAALAVPVALTVGLLAAGSGPATPIAAAANPAVGSEQTTLANPAAGPIRPTPAMTGPATAPADRIVHLIVPSRALDGTVAGATTLAICWTLLGVIGALWRRRLDRRDRRAWAESWTQVEPTWSARLPGPPP